ncbi:GATOR complex protein wdr59 [Phytophthora pseudosyringae]|uniref:GATOR complex protein wdr59 n=1 Tax=Phytophthora pseudosyringae TaxID=221518 RepID=A0A8T1VIW0_9STRA|nr:GATOR complex protein wdr59 [Phytophthora pseudosyringae]
MRRRHRSSQATRGATSAQDAGRDPHSVSSGAHDVSSSASPASGGSVSTAGVHNVNVHLDLNASALSVDATGSVAVLAGRKGLHLVDLETPFLPPATLYHQTKLEVTVVKCNPHALFKSHVASSSNRNTLIWDIAGVGVGPGAAASIGAGQGSAGAYKHGHSSGGGADGGSGSQTTTQPLVATLRAHTRPVSDVAWSPMEPSLLATCSADAKTLLWDMRSPQRPVQTLNAFNTSVIQVEWNRVDATSLATAHDGEVRVWDLRAAGERTVAPAALITAHMQKIYGLDWHPQRMYELVTCSEDKTVKLWDVTQPRVCQGTLTTGAPVWRAQYTPFGDGLVTISQRMDNTIRLWALSHGGGDNGGNGDAGDLDVSSVNAGASVTAELVHSFVGHGDLVKGMAWRVRPQTSVYQLVSWSKDQELRMWHVDVPQLEACGYDTASYLADVAPSEGNNPTARHQSDARRLLHAEFAEMHAQHSKYSLSALKTDFVPLVIPKSAVPLNTDEYTLEGNDSSLQALLALEEELIKGGESQSQPASGEDESPVPGTGDKDDAQSDDSASTKEEAASTSGARALPCPRISGAAFSGPNMLLVFDSRVAIGQSRSSAVHTAVAAGKESKPQASPNKLPRTYEELLDLRDSRFATKKNKKPPVKLLSSANIMGSMDVGTNDWAGQQQQPQELIDGGVVVGVFGEDDSVSAHGYRHASMYYSSGSGGAGGKDDILSGMNEMEPSIHGGSEYLNTYFSNAEYHLPVNNPEHLLSMPTSATAGLQLSPRSSVRANTAERLKRVEQPAPALNLDLSISVTILDLSKLCGVSSILTYQTDLVPRGSTPAAVSPKTSMSAKRKKSQFGSVNRSMISWMLRAAEDMPGKRGVSSTNNLTRVLQGLLTERDATAMGQQYDGNIPADESCTALAATCAQNARTAMLAGRSDLQQIWSLLEISAAPDLELPIYKKNPNSSTSLCLRTSHPWSAHPLGKRLVHKVLDMYEQAGDVQALASIVCALKPNERKEPDEIRESVTPSAITMEDQLPVVREDRRSSIEEVGSMMGSTTTGATASISSGMRSRRSSSNALSQLMTDSNDAPPVMRSTRRSSSHSEARSQGLPVDKDAALRASKDWPLVSSGTNSAASSRQSSPIRDHTLSTTTSYSSGLTSDGKGPPSGSGWKMDFERLENPFKTWSGSSGKEAPPPRLTADTFQRPIQAVNGKSPAASMTVTASPRGDPVSPSPLHGALGAAGREEEVDANDRVLLQLSFRSVDDEKRLLSSLPEDEARYDIYKEAYADVLYRYGAMNLRNEVLKTKSHGVQDPRGISMGLICASCNAKTIDPVCSSCRDFAVRCSVCQLVVRGQSMFCMTCGHGGHAAHLREWFEVETACPTGCGCWCKQATATMPAYQLEQQEADHVAPSRSHSF